ncbi:MAG: hypothetical protein QW520_06665 [Methanomassiliicoccales archaeon]
MKKGILALFVAALFFFAVPVMAKPVVAPSSCMDSSPLMAAKNMQVGYVNVTREVNEVVVTFEINVKDWYILETHVGVSTKDPGTKPYNGDPGIPQTKTGNPIPGLFPYGNEYDILDYKQKDEIRINIIDIKPGSVKTGDCFYIAAHAKLVHLKTMSLSTIIVSNENISCWSGAMQNNIEDGYIVPPNEGWTNSVLAWVHPSWNNNLGPANAKASLFADPAANWIWSENPVSNARSYTGDIVFFKQKIDLPPTAFNINAKIFITTDNAYYFYVNDDWKGEPLGKDGFVSSDPTNFYYVADGSDKSGGYNSVPYETIGGLYPLENKISTDIGVWSSIEEYDLSSRLSGGFNQVQIVAINEHAPPSGYDNNPGGLIYKINVSCDYHVADMYESAWAAGYDFKGANWATYFCYCLPCYWEKIDELTIPATGVKITTSVTLEAGKKYKIEASGLCNYRYPGSPQGYLADAEYWNRNDALGVGWIKMDSLPAPYNGTFWSLVLWDGAKAVDIDWGAYKDDHVYSIIKEPSTSEKLTFYFKDDYYGDNSGYLTVKIFECK